MGAPRRLITDCLVGAHFTDPTGNGWTPANIEDLRAQKLPFRRHAVEAACADLDIEHRLARPGHPWTNGQSLPRRRPGSNE